MSGPAKTLAILTVCDGLNPDWINKEHTPVIAGLRTEGMWCADHGSVFPSVTRNASASLTTGCRSVVHGLHGNTMALNEKGRLVVRDVGRPDFRHYMRRATGATLRAPSLAERIKKTGVAAAYSNVSPGAAYFLDPEHFGWVYHRAGSFGPGGEALPNGRGLDVSHDSAGDQDMTARFCDDVATRPDLALGILWLSNPDATMHLHPLGSPEHLKALREADACVGLVAETVSRLRARGHDVLFLVGSDHGMETVCGYKDIQAELAEAGVGDAFLRGDAAVAPQGSGALIYASPEARPRIGDALKFLAGRPWVDRVIPLSGLHEVGHGPLGGLVAAVDMGRIDEANPFGVPGMRWGAAKSGKGDVSPLPTGTGIHGGLGADETRPFLIALGRDYAPGSKTDKRTGLVDIAPTILDFLNISQTGMEGGPLPKRA
ncbi:MAG: alkaline phosphatase family protein [Desulfovibrionaceae bacterium]|nr:alkaline phosphatase family protein [Desulfovibrionaceae bacterium]